MPDFFDIWGNPQKQGKLSPLKFWPCYVEGTNGGVHYKHYNLHAARKEAERLARINPGKSVYLLECIGKCKVPLIQVEWEIPK